MVRHFLKISWLIVFAALIAGYARLLDSVDSYEVFLPLFLVLMLAVVSLVYIAKRFLLFRANLTRVFRMLISGNYEVGLNPSGAFKDEFESLQQLIAKFLDQLREYDRLRAERISLTNRFLTLLYNSVQEGVVIVNMDKEIFQCNPAVQALFGIKQETFTFDSMRQQKDNHSLMRLLVNATEIKKIPQEGTARVQMPVQSQPKDVFMRIIPLKDKDEKVKMAFIFVSPADSQPTASDNISF
jgi:PAS domain-containing protein